MSRSARRRAWVWIGTFLCARFALGVVNQWSPVGPYRHGGAVTAIAVDPLTPSTVYVGTQLYGLFRSVDAGQTWPAVNNGLTSYSILSLAIDPVTTSTVYAVASSSPYLVSSDPEGGVFKSTDSGAGWARVLAVPPDGQYSVIAIDPTNPQTLYVGSNFGIQKSTDGGASWVGVSDALGGVRVSGIAVDPSSPSTLYAACGAVFKSTDGGSHWISTGLTDAYKIRIDPRSPSTVYAVGPGGVYKSTNGGGTWTPRSSGLLNNKRDLAIDPVSSTLFLTAGPDGVFRSTDGAASWHSIDVGLPSGGSGRLMDPIAVVPGASGSLLVGSFGFVGGLFRSTDGGAHWTDTSGDFTPLNACSVAASRLLPAIYAATDGGVFQTTDQGEHWQPINAGLSDLNIYGVVPDPQSAATLYARSPTRLFKTSNGGASWFPLLAGPSNNKSVHQRAHDRSRSFVHTLCRDRGDARRRLRALEDSRRRTDLDLDPAVPRPDPHDRGGSVGLRHGLCGDGRRQHLQEHGCGIELDRGLPNPGGVPDAFVSLAIDPESPETVYAGSVFAGPAIPELARPGSIFRTVDGGVTWDNLRTGNGVSDILIDPSDSSTLTVSLTGIELIRTSNAGASFSNANTGLHGATSLAANPMQPDTIFAASRGVFRATFACPGDDSTHCRHVSRATRERQPVQVPTRGLE